MKSGFDISRLSGDGYLILPLSMSYLAPDRRQDPHHIYKILAYMLPKLETYNCDIVVLYTYELYLNTKEFFCKKQSALRRHMHEHRQSLHNLICKNKLYVPAAFHYLPFDYIPLNAPDFLSRLNLLEHAEKKDRHFQRVIQCDLQKRPYTKTNISFLLEEITAAHILRQHLIGLPCTLARQDIWRLIVYPGSPLQADVYQWQHRILPQKDRRNPYTGGQYDFEQKIFINFDDSSSAVTS